MGMSQPWHAQWESWKALGSTVHLGRWEWMGWSGQAQESPQGTSALESGPSAREEDGQVLGRPTRVRLAPGAPSGLLPWGKRGTRGREPAQSSHVHDFAASGRCNEAEGGAFGSSTGSLRVGEAGWGLGGPTLGPRHRGTGQGLMGVSQLLAGPSSRPAGRVGARQASQPRSHFPWGTGMRLRGQNCAEESGPARHQAHRRLQETPTKPKGAREGP